MPDKVNIPVEVTGDEEAKRDLKQVGQAVEGVGASGAKSAAGSKQAAAASREHATAKRKVAGATAGAAKQVNTFDDAARTAVRRGLGTINPMLGEMVSMVNDVAKGAGRISVGLLGFAGVGLVLGVVAAGFQKIAEGARRAEEAIKAAKKARMEREGKGVATRADIARELVGMGVEASATQQVIEGLRSQMEAGVPKELALAFEKARAAGLVGAEQRRQFQAGIVARGGKAPEFTGDQRANAQEVARLLRLGEGAEPQRLLDAFITQVREEAMREAPTVHETMVLEQLTEVEKLKKRQPTLTEADIEIIQAGARRGVSPRQAIEARRGFFERWGSRMGFRVQPGEATLDIEELIRLATELRAAIAAREFGGEHAPELAGKEPPLVVNFNNTINQGTVYGLHGQEPQGIQSYEFR